MTKSLFSLLPSVDLAASKVSPTRIRRRLCSYAGANFHFWPDCCDCADDSSALVRGDAVAAAQRRVRSEHAQNSFHVLETMPCIFEQSAWAGDQSPMQIGKPIAANHEFAPGTTCLQRTRDMEKAALVTVELVRKAALQSFARVIQPLLRVAHPVEQLARERAGATVDTSLEIVNIGNNQFRCRARRRRAQIRDEIAMVKSIS